MSDHFETLRIKGDFPQDTKPKIITHKVAEFGPYVTKNNISTFFFRYYFTICLFSSSCVILHVHLFEKRILIEKNVWFFNVCIGEPDI